jgi:hypothetical protein
VRVRWLVAGILLTAGIGVYFMMEPEAPPAASIASGESFPAADRSSAKATNARQIDTPLQKTAKRTPAMATCQLDADFLQYRRDQARQLIPRLYEDVPEQVGLSEGETSRLMELLVEQTAERDMPLELTCGEAAIDFRKEMSARHANELARIIDARRMPAFHRYTSTLDARYEAYDLADALQVSHLPITESQRRSLADIFLRDGAVQSPPSHLPGQSPESFLRDLNTWMDQRDRKLIDGAAEVLDTIQVHHYARALEARRSNDISRRFRDAGVTQPDYEPQ